MSSCSLRAPYCILQHDIPHSVIQCPCRSVFIPSELLNISGRMQQYDVTDCQNSCENLQLIVLVVDISLQHPVLAVMLREIGFGISM